MRIKDYYNILGVSEKASQEEVKKAYWQLAKKWHPDANLTDKTAEDRFKEINEAYEVLGDVFKRNKYDELRSGVERTRKTKVKARAVDVDELYKKCNVNKKVIPSESHKYLVECLAWISTLKAPVDRAFWERQAYAWLILQSNREECIELVNKVNEKVDFQRVGNFYVIQKLIHRISRINTTLDMDLNKMRFLNESIVKICNIITTKENELVKELQQHGFNSDMPLQKTERRALFEIGRRIGVSVFESEKTFGEKWKEKLRRR